MFLVLEQHELELSYEANLQSSPIKPKSIKKEAIKKEKKVKNELRLPPIKKEKRRVKLERTTGSESSYERKRALSQLSDTQEARSPPQHKVDAPYSLRSRRAASFESDI
jgi:hypothetical protein